jgi:hypothetical protein
MPFDFSGMMNDTGRFTIGFVKINDARVASMGSGTPVTLGSIGGILTCAHVLEEVVKLDEIGIVYFPVRSSDCQTLRVPRSDIDYVEIGRPPWTEVGPDMGFVRLPPATMSALKAVASVLNVEKQRAAVLADEPDPQNAFDMVTGVIAEWTSPTSVAGSTATTQFELLLNVGEVIDSKEVGGFDIYRFKPKPAPGFALPGTYEGTSGGGLWRLYTKKNDDGSFSLVQRRLAGIAFWQTPPPRNIICHGQRSLYENLVQAIRQRWPAG